MCFKNQKVIINIAEFIIIYFHLMYSYVLICKKKTNRNDNGNISESSRQPITDQKKKNVAKNWKRVPATVYFRCHALSKSKRSDSDCYNNNNKNGKILKES